MKITLRKINDKLTVYVSKKDLEVDVVSYYEEGGKYFLKLANGWELQFTEKIENYPKTINAKKVS